IWLTLLPNGTLWVTSSQKTSVAALGSLTLPLRLSLLTIGPCGTRLAHLSAAAWQRSAVEAPLTDTVLPVATGARPTELDRALDRSSALDGRLHGLRAAWTGPRPMAYLSPKSREALGDRLGRLGVNYPRLTVESLAERMTL